MFRITLYLYAHQPLFGSCAAKYSYKRWKRKRTRKIVRVRSIWCSICDEVIKLLEKMGTGGIRDTKNVQDRPPLNSMTSVVSAGYHAPIHSVLSFSRQGRPELLFFSEQDSSSDCWLLRSYLDMPVRLSCACMLLKTMSLCSTTLLPCNGLEDAPGNRQSTQ